MTNQEAKMLVARAYRRTEKLLQDNRDKLMLVRLYHLYLVVLTYCTSSLTNTKVQDQVLYLIL